MNNPRSLFPVVVSAALLVPAVPAAEDTYAGYDSEPTRGDHIGEKEYSPYLDIGYPQRVFWGDTHVHTSYSTDAGMIGNRLGPDDAYRFARGETVVSSTGVQARPLNRRDYGIDVSLRLYVPDLEKLNSWRPPKAKKL